MGRIDPALLDAPTECDELGRSALADRVAEELLKVNQQCANVVAINGPWGSGKSSFTKAVVKRIGDKAIVKRFEPWMVADETSLIIEFFKTLLSSLEGDAERRKRTELAKRLARFAARVGSAGGLVGAAANVAAQAAEDRFIDRTLVEDKAELFEKFSDLSAPRVIVVDDIDRLDGKEIQALFRVLKASADLPNVSYLLVFDRDHVASALGSDSIEGKDKRRGELYLEKIVNLSFDLPEFTLRQREVLLRGLIDAHLSLLRPRDNNAAARLEFLVDGVLLPGLETVRQMKRFIRTVLAIVPSVCSERSQAVDPADFLALEFLRQHEPTVYEGLVAEMCPPVGGKFAASRDRDNSEKIAIRRRAFLPADERRRGLVYEALGILVIGLSDDWTKFDFQENVEGFQSRRFGCKYCTGSYLGFDRSRAVIADVFWSQLLFDLEENENVSYLFQRFENAVDRSELATALVDLARDELSADGAKHLLCQLLEWAGARHCEGGARIGSPMPWPLVVEFIGKSCFQMLDKADKLEPTVNELWELVQLHLPLSSLLSRCSYKSTLQVELDAEIVSKLQPLINAASDYLEFKVEDRTIFQAACPREALDSWRRLVGEARFEDWRASLAGYSVQLVDYLDCYLGAYPDNDESLWYVELNDPLSRAIIELDPALLDDRGKWARKKFLEGWESAVQNSGR